MNPWKHQYLTITLFACTVFSCAEPLEEQGESFLSLKALGNGQAPGYGYICEGSECQLSDSMKELFSERVGFGRETTGGLGGSHCIVNNFADAGEGTLRQCAERGGPVWITFAQSGTINLSNNIDLPSNSTVDGRGHKVTIEGAGLHIKGVENVLITHIKIQKASDDAIQIKYESRLAWINHVSLADSYDGLLDITRGSTDVTISWCRFDNHRKVLLISGGHETEIDDNIRVTIHHNYFNKTFSRHPRVRRGKVHIYNNLFNKLGNYGIACSHYGECISEANIFDTEKRLTRTSGMDPEPGSLRSVNDWSVRNKPIEERNPEDVFESSDYYEHFADEANQDLLDLIKQEAGWIAVDGDPNQYETPLPNLCSGDVPTIDMPSAQHTADELFIDGAKIRLRASSGHYVTAEEGGGKGFVADRTEASSWETFTVVRHESGRIGLKTDGEFFMTAEDGDSGLLIADRQGLGEWELFTPVETNEGRFALQAHTGMFVVAECGGGTLLSANRTEAGAWESFLIELASAAPPQDNQTNPPANGDNPPALDGELFQMNRQLHIQAANGQYLSAEEGGGSIVIANRNQASEWETFTIITRDLGMISLKTSNGFFLSAEEGGGGRLTADRTTIGEWELFTPVSIGGDKYALKTSNGHYLVAENGGGGEVNADRTQSGEWETLIIRAAN